MDTLKRLEIVGQLWDHSRPAQLAGVNAVLERRGMEPITLATLDRDRVRVKELLQEKVRDSSGVRGRLDQLQRLHDEMWRRLRQIPDPYGNPASAVAAVILRAIEDGAKLDGSWGAGGVEVNVNVDTSSFGRTPHQQLEQGEITEDEYLVALRVLHQQTSAGGVQQQAQKRIEGETQEIEGEFRDVTPERLPNGPTGSTGPTVRRGSNGNGNHPMPRNRRMADEPRIVEPDPGDFDG